jgi:anaerobic magnesium-protoporphyrin IX monomethyl ester cyclase
MKILLVQPPSRNKQRESVIVPSLGLAYLASALEEAKYDVKILDSFASRQAWPEFEEAVRHTQADLIGIGGMTPTIDITCRAAKICRKYCKFLVIGGPHATVFGQEIFSQIPEADFAVSGEGEQAFRELAGVLNSGKPVGRIPGIMSRDLTNTTKGFIEDLDSLPFPARHLLPNHCYRYIFSRKRIITTMITSRGCPFRCIFCDKSVSGSIFRSRSVKNILDEIGRIAEEFKNVSVIFYDDLFTFDKKRLIGICRGILERNIRIDWKCESRVDTIDAEMLGWMKRAGCSMIAYGVESGNRNGLDYLRKGADPEQARKAFDLTRKNGVRTMAYFILGIPVETYNDELETIKFANRLRPDYAQFSVLSPFKGTELYEFSLKSGSYAEVDANNPVDKDLKRPALLSSNWNERRLNMIVREAHKRFYLRPSYILRRLLSIRSLGDARASFMAGSNLLSWFNRMKAKYAR